MDANHVGRFTRVLPNRSMSAKLARTARAATTLIDEERQARLEKTQRLRIAREIASAPLEPMTLAVKD